MQNKHLEEFDKRQIIEKDIQLKIFEISFRAICKTTVKNKKQGRYLEEQKKFQKM